MHLKLWK